MLGIVCGCSIRLAVCSPGSRAFSLRLRVVLSDPLGFSQFEQVPMDHTMESARRLSLHLLHRDLTTQPRVSREARAVRTGQTACWPLAHSRDSQESGMLVRSRCERLEPSILHQTRSRPDQPDQVAQPDSFGSPPQALIIIKSLCVSEVIVSPRGSRRGQQRRT